MKGSTLLNKKTDLEHSQQGILNVIFFLIIINGVLGELSYGVDGLGFTDDLAIYKGSSTYVFNPFLHLGVSQNSINKVLLMPCIKYCTALL